MVSYWDPWNLIYLSPVVIGWYIALVFYLLHAQGVLSRPAAGTSTMPPHRVWLALIPVFGFVWVIVVALALSESLESEIRANEIRNFTAPGRAFGITAGCLLCVATIFLALAIAASATGLSVDSEFGGNQVSDFGWAMWFLAGASGLGLWIAHWAQSSRVSSRLAQPGTWSNRPQPYPGAYVWSQPQYPGAPGPATPGAFAREPNGEFCPACGRYVPGTLYCPLCGKDRRQGGGKVAG